jgi:hypothetical protein
MLIERTAVTAGGPAATESRVPLTFVEIADAVEVSRPAFEAGGVFAPTMLDRVVGILRS